MKKMKDDRMDDKKIGNVVFDFIENMDALNDSAPFVLSTVTTVASKFTQAHVNYLEKYGDVIEQDEEKKVYSVPIERQGRVRRLREQSSSLRTSSNLIPRNFLVSFVSEFDCFLGALLRAIYTKKPELLNDSSRQISYADLLAFDSLEDAKDQVLEKEIDSILRKSHSDHFASLESKFDVPLRKGLDIWSDFIEITERRNLFVHCNGIVSSQYIKVCKQHGCDISSVVIGEKLKVDAEYLRKAYKVIYEISVKLAHVLWRKLFPAEREDADDNLNNVCFSLVSRGKHHLAVDLLEFGISLPKHHNDTIKRMMIINLAQAYKRSNDTGKCENLLKRFDWSATGYEFKLAVAVLNEENEKAAKLLKTVVNAGDLSEQEVVDWPLFKEFRKTDPFLSVFKELFDKDYAQQEELVKAEFKDHMDSIFTEDKDADKEEKSNIQSAAEDLEQSLVREDA